MGMRGSFGSDPQQWFLGVPPYLFRWIQIVVCFHYCYFRHRRWSFFFKQEGNIFIVIIIRLIIQGRRRFGTGQTRNDSRAQNFSLLLPMKSGSRDKGLSEVSIQT
mmetsp:Transcript_93694/g.262109  ORF Transcript_93694/g.262109 Transcript_93694/m.262109 type:complete len:105 (+) Transcript_93694:152-466(+)